MKRLLSTTHKVLKPLFTAAAQKIKKTALNFDEKYPETSGWLTNKYAWSLKKVMPPLIGSYIYTQTFLPRNRVAMGSTSLVGTSWMPIPAVSTISALIVFDGLRAVFHVRAQKREGTYVSNADLINRTAIKNLAEKDNPEKHLILDDLTIYSRN